MKLGQTSAIVFLSKLLASVLGFGATIMFARLLGAEPLGYYASTVTLVAILAVGGKVGISGAVAKRISEDETPGAFVSAGLVTISAFTLVTVSIILLFGDVVDRYIGTEVALFVAIILVVKVLHSFFQAVLKGHRLVHIAGALDPLRTGSRSVIQIGFLLGGAGLTGMLIGYSLGYVIATAVGVIFVSLSINRPGRDHFVSLFDYAKYSWLGNLENRTYRDVDFLVLTFFHPGALVGIYMAAWSLTKVLMLFGKSIRATLFPEISYADAQNDLKQARSLITDGLSYGGLVFIPGLVGGILLGEKLLEVFGPEFTQGTFVLAILLLAGALYSYQKQLLNAINAIDRPDLAFRVNAVFIMVNVVGNVSLVYAIGWEGAAIATAFAAGVGVVLSYVALQRTIELSFPWRDVGYQVAAAGVMAAVLVVCRGLVPTTESAVHDVGVVLVLVGIGTFVYGVTLLAISRPFRRTIVRNLPFNVPVLTKQ